MYYKAAYVATFCKKARKFHTITWKLQSPREDDITRTRSHSPIYAHAHWYGAEVLHLSAFEVPNNEKKNTKINLYCNRYESTITTAQKRAKIIQKESVPAKGEDM